MTTPGTGPDRRTPTAGPATILVVDDSKAIRAILRRALEETGYTVVEAEDGSRGLEAMRAQPVDLVLLDIDMPVMDGLTTMEHMKADPPLAELPVLFLTARTTGQDVAVGLGLGAQDYLRKPCEPAELTARVGTALRLRAQQLQLREQTRRLDDLSMTDPLTGVGNRRLLESALAELLASRPDAPVGWMICDLDLFKRVNDTYGHPVGDTVLRVTAARIRSSVPAGATLVRFGGEEFLALCPGVTGADLLEAAEAVRRKISGAPLSVGVEEPLGITVSIGCAWGPASDHEGRLAAADKALYEAKLGGRDGVRMAGA